MQLLHRRQYWLVLICVAVVSWLGFFFLLKTWCILTQKADLTFKLIYPAGGSISQMSYQAADCKQLLLQWCFLKYISYFLSAECFRRVSALNLSSLPARSDFHLLRRRELIPTDQQGAVGGRGAVLPLQEFVEEGGDAGDDGGEAALGQHQQQEERTQQEAEKHPGKHWHTQHTLVTHTHTHLTSAWLKRTQQHTLTLQEVEQRHVRLLEVVVHVVFPLNHLPKQKEKRELCVVRAETQWELQMIQIVCDSAQQGVHSLLVKCWQTRLSCNEGAAAASQRLRNTCSRQEELLSRTF